MQRAVPPPFPVANFWSEPLRLVQWCSMERREPPWIVPLASGRNKGKQTGWAEPPEKKLGALVKHVAVIRACPILISCR